jgi:hypothetical protein
MHLIWLLIDFYTRRKKMKNAIVKFQYHIQPIGCNLTTNQIKIGEKVFSAYLSDIESWVAFVNPSNARFREHRQYPRGAFGCASLLIVFELVWNQPNYRWDKQ